jgi:hypothetical protein
MEQGVLGLGGCSDLSEELRALPVEQHLALDPTFRNPRGFEASSTTSSGMTPMGLMDVPTAVSPTRLVWEEFGRDANRVEAAATDLRASYADAKRRNGSPRRHP